MAVLGRARPAARRARGYALAVVVVAQWWRGSPWARPRSARALRQQNAELTRSRDAERRRVAHLEAELEQTRAVFDRTLARVNDLFWTVEVMPDGEITIDFLSSNASGVLGGAIGEGSDAAALRARMAHPDDAEVNAAFTAAMRAGQPAEVEERIVGFDGVVRWAWSRGTPRREGGRLFFDGVSTNITERHELDAQREALLKKELEQVATLEELHRARDDFIALAGHELRTPLTVIQGYAEHVLEDEALTGEHRHQLEIVVRRAGLMSDLIDDLFDLAKLDSHVEPIEFDPVRLDELVRHSVEAHEPAAWESGNEVELELVAVTVLGERRRLRRMVDNVIDNAVRYSPSGGRITVTVAQEGDDALLQVTDQGMGIPAEEMSHVFDRLIRGSNAIEARIPGTGLGLSSVLAIAEGHGGSADVGSGSAGTVLTVRLPAH